MGLNSIEAVWSLCMALNTGLTGSVLYFILIASISMESVASGGSKDGGMEIGEWGVAVIWAIMKRA